MVIKIDTGIKKPEFWVCHGCDLMVDTVVVPSHYKVYCPRCSTLLHSNVIFDNSKFLALLITGFVLYLLANIYTVVSIEMVGINQEMTLIKSVIAMWKAGFYAVSILIFVVVLLVPLLRLLLLLFVVVALMFEYCYPGARKCMHMYMHLGEWSMIEIYMLSLLVSMVKFSDMANLNIGAGFVFLMSFMFIEVLFKLNLNSVHIWREIGFD